MDEAKASQQKLNLVIVGGGTAGWMTAAALAQACKDRVAKITLIESDDIGTVGVGEATIPPIQVYNHYLGLDVKDFVQKTHATFKLGIEFKDWTRQGHRYLHQFGPIGMEMLGGVGFHHFWLKLRQEGFDTDIEEYSPNAMAARLGRFMLADGKDPNPLNYAYHFDASLYARYLRHYAESRGVIRQEGKIVAVEQNEETGFVTRLRLEGDQRIGGDFFIDCSGFRGLLIEETLGAGYEDWSHWLPCDRAVAVPCESGQDWEPYTRSTAREAGWQWHIPLQHRVGNGYVFASNFLSDERAAEDLLTQLEGRPLADPRFLRFKAGRRKKSWSKNVLAIGLASGFLEPLESTSIHLIQTAIFRFLTLFPLSQGDPASEEEFNRLSKIEMEHVRDFIIFHYKATERDDSELWKHTSSMSIPESLQFKIDLFRHRGRVARFNEQLIFQEANWVPVFLGQNIVPQHYDPLVDSGDWENSKRIIADIRRVIRGRVEKMPNHKEWVQANCPSHR